MIRRLLTEELAYEKKLLAKLKSKNVPRYDTILIRSGSGSFYCRKRGQKKKVFVPRSNTKLLLALGNARFCLQKIKILENNIAALEKALLKINEYDDLPVLDSIPKVYAEALQVARKSERRDGAVTQSENPYKREELTIVVSNGLLVRTREELIIAELLLSLGIRFWYEKALTLQETVTMSDGTVISHEVTKYPDFTIQFADGTLFYWEHCGRLDLGTYRENLMKKLELYTANGIFAPARLLITTSGKGEAINMPAMKELVMKMILPYCKA